MKPLRQSQGKFSGREIIPPAGTALLLAGITVLGLAVAEEEAEVDSAPDRRPVRQNIVDPDLVPTAARVRPGKVIFRGLKGIEESEARDLIRFQVRNLEENGVTMARADDAAFFLEESLRNQGFDKARVAWEISPGNDVVLAIDQGSEIMIGEVTASGNEHLSVEAIRELLTQVTRKRLGYRADAPNIPYVADDITEGVNAVRHFYGLMGYADAEVSLVSSQLRQPGDAMDVSLAVREGSPRSVGRIDFPEAIEPGMETLYADLESEFSGRPFTAAISANLASRIADAAHEAGYHEAAVEIQSARPRKAPPQEDGTPLLLVVDLTVVANWGERYTLSSVKVEGTEKIRDGVIERRFLDLVGEPYSPSKVNETIEELIETGAFKGLLFEALPQADRTIALTVKAEEAKRHSVGVYGGYGTYEGPILGLDYQYFNFLGRLHTFHIDAEVNARGVRGDIGYTNRWFLNSKWKLKMDLLSQTEQNEGYEVFDIGFRAGLQRSFGRKERHRLTVFTLPRYSEITDADIDDAFLGPQDYFVSRAGLVYSYDQRDDPVNPRKGFAADVAISGASSAIGSEVDFAKIAGRAVYLVPIGKTTLRLGARAGMIRPSDDEDLPIDLRIFSGGARSVRSFQERDLGPKDPNNYPIGGEFGTIFNIEYDIPVAGPISIAPFVDAGNLLSDYEDASLDDMHYAGGAGLIFNSPIGPLRIDYGHNLNQGKREPSGNWHVGFGFAF